MQISSVSSSLTVYSQKTNTDSDGKVLPQVQKSAESGNSFKQYNLQNISPREIDQLASELRKSGDFDVRNILMLETNGEKFQSHLSANSGRDFDESKKSDLMGSIEENINMSKQRNEPTLLAEGLLKLLQKIDAAQSIPSEGLFA